LTQATFHAALGIAMAIAFEVEAQIWLIAEGILRQSKVL
jgi:hypothetical protein